jgi:hypothetical protein
VFHEVNSEGSDLWILDLEAGGKAQPFMKTSFWEFGPRFSPDGKWLACAADDSSRPEIYVQPFPGPGAKVQVSTEGGSEAIWSRDGRDLFDVNGQKIMGVRALGKGDNEASELVVPAFGQDVLGDQVPPKSEGAIVATRGPQTLRYRTWIAFEIGKSQKQQC